MNITRPTLLLDLGKMTKNFDMMIDKAARTGTALVPHFKTHQSKEIGELFSSRGIDKIAVSSMKMAAYFFDAGWKDITIAFPFNILEIDELNRLLRGGCTCTLLLTELSSISFLEEHLEDKVQVMLELDAGYGRSGVSVKNLDLIQEMVDQISSSNHLALYGLYCHPGNTYQANSIEEIRQIWSTVIKRVNFVKSKIQPPVDLKIRIGDTPGCSVVEEMHGVDEIGPGNFIFYDLVMNYLGVCSEDQIAVAVACPVVAKKENNRVVIHGGAVHFSKDHLFGQGEQKFFGEMVILEEKGWSQIIPDAKLISVSQEHGILELDPVTYEAIAIGDVVGILPIHSCLTANLMKSYHTLDGQVFSHLEKNH
jgi:D-serine deaminase-like pyridoxal phosphate-dependent protein